MVKTAGAVQAVGAIEAPNSRAMPTLTLEDDWVQSRKHGTALCLALQRPNIRKLHEQFTIFSCCPRRSFHAGSHPFIIIILHFFPQVSYIPLLCFSLPSLKSLSATYLSPSATYSMSSASFKPGLTDLGGAYCLLSLPHHLGNTLLLLWVRRHTLSHPFTAQSASIPQYRDTLC